MAKRLSETEIWKEEWHRELPMEYKCFWKYLCDNCDLAGVWKKDIGLASFQIGTQISIEKALTLFNKEKIRVVVLNNGYKWFIPQFIDFQYGELKDSSPVHKKVLELLRKHGIPYPYPIDRVLDTLQEKEEDKDKEKEKETKDLNINKNIKKERLLEFVLLTNEEYEKLFLLMGKRTLEGFIEELNDAIGSKGLKYKSHFHTIRNWWRRKGKPKDIIVSNEPIPTKERIEATRKKLQEMNINPNILKSQSTFRGGDPKKIGDILRVKNG